MGFFANELSPWLCVLGDVSSNSFFGHSTWLAGSQFSDQELNLGPGSESPES